MEPLRERKDRLPHLSDLVEGMPNVRSMIPPPVSIAPPNSPERRYDDDPALADAEPLRRRSTLNDLDERRQMLINGMIFPFPGALRDVGFRRRRAVSGLVPGSRSTAPNR